MVETSQIKPECSATAAARACVTAMTPIITSTLVALAPLRPMETAPKDGTLIWIQFRRAPGLELGYWSSRFGTWLADSDEGRMALIWRAPLGWASAGAHLYVRQADICDRPRHRV